MSLERVTVAWVSRTAAAQIVGVSVTRLIRYERQGLVSPRRTEGRLWYGPSDLARLRRLRRLVDDLGVNLAGAEVILRLLDRIADLEQGRR